RTRVAAARRHTATTAAALTATAAFAPATAFTAIAAATAPTPATAARAPPPAAIAAAGGLQMSALAIARIRRLAFSRGLDRLLHRIRSRLHRLRGFRDFGAGCDRDRLRLATDRLLAFGRLRRCRGSAHQRDHARAVDVQLLDAAQPRDQARRAGRPAETARLERVRQRVERHRPPRTREVLHDVDDLVMGRGVRLLRRDGLRARRTVHRRLVHRARRPVLAASASAAAAPPTPPAAIAAIATIAAIAVP